MTEQLALGVTLRDEAIFDNFYVSEANQEAVSHVRSTLEGEPSFLFLWGAPSTGKTHLLQSCCHAWPGRGRAPCYLPLHDRSLVPEVLDSLEKLPLVCLDNVEEVMGDLAWEEALFHFYNRAQESGTVLIVASRFPPRQLPSGLADLQSRLTAGLTNALSPLSDEEKVTVLTVRANYLGLSVSSDVALFLIRRYSQDLAHLCELILYLDRAALSTKRKLTIRLVKEVLALG